jgi:protein TonB
VRIELTVDASGNVVQVRLVEGLGHGLDEAAVEAARGYRFEPARRCGKAVAATFTIAIRFAL